MTSDNKKAAITIPTSLRLAVHMLGNAVCPPVMTDLINEIRHVA